MAEECDDTTITTLRVSWATGKPTRHDHGAVITELNSANLVGKEIVLERGAYVPVTHLNYLRPLDDAFRSELNTKDRRSAK